MGSFHNWPCYLKLRCTVNHTSDLLESNVWLQIILICFIWIYRMVQKDGIRGPVPVVGGMACRVNGASTRARKLVAVFKVLFSLYGLTCVGYGQNSLEFVSRSPLIHSVGRSFLPLHRQPICSNWWFQRQMLFLFGGWMLKRRRNARCTAVGDSVLMNSRTQKIWCCIVDILLSTDAAARLCARRAL